jgi:CBS domain-containing protein
LSLTVAKAPNYYQRYALDQYVRALSAFRNFKFVLIVDKSGSFVAFAPQWAIGRLLQGLDGDRFVGALNEGRIAELRAYESIVTQTITTQATNAEALSAMERNNLEAIIVLDPADRRPVGVVERDRLLTKMVLGLAKPRR